MTREKLTLEPLDLASAWSEEPPELEFALPGLVLGTVGTLVATGGTGKSWLALETAIGVAVGRDVGGLWGSDPVGGGAVYVSLEDPTRVLKTRLWALRDLVPEAERGRVLEGLTVLPSAGHARAIAQASAGQLAPTRWFDALSDLAAEVRPRLLVLDTLNRAIGEASENDAGPMGAILSLVEVLAQRAGCAVVLCHHVSKSSATGAGAEQAHAARGSSVISDNSRWQANLSRPGSADRRYDALSDEDRRDLVRLDVTKASYGPPLPTRWLRRGRCGVLQGCERPAGIEEVVGTARPDPRRPIRRPGPRSG